MAFDNRDRRPREGRRACRDCQCPRRARRHECAVPRGSHTRR